MSRSEARENAFMLLYAYTVQKEDRESQRRLFLEEHPMNADDLSFFDTLIDGVVEKREFLDSRISPCLNRWALHRLPNIDLSILRLAAFEMEYLQEVPDAVAISEAVLLARKYSSEEARSYINAVLGTLSRQEKSECETDSASEN